MSIESMLGISHKLLPVIRARTIQNHTMLEAIAAKPLHTASNRNCSCSTSMCGEALRSVFLNTGVATSISNANNDRRIMHARGAERICARARLELTRRGCRVVKPVAGEIVVIPFPCADGSGEKWRPAFVIAHLPGADLILCQICFGNSRSEE